VARAIATVMRVVRKEEGEGGKAMVMATRVAGERTAMATKIREAGKEEEIGKVGKSNGDGKEDGNGGQQ
jgi:hypothetical protein